MKNKYNNSHLLLLLFTSLLSFINIYAQENTRVQAKIIVSKTDSYVSISATAINCSAKTIGDLSYEILSVKDSNGNYSRNKQAGVFAISPKENKILSKQVLNIDSKSIIKLSLVIRKNKEIVDEHILTITGNKVSFRKANSDAIFSQRANDFCNYLNKIHKNEETYYPFIVSVSEKSLTNKVTSEISVSVDNKLIYKFKSLAKVDYLFAAAQETNKRLKKHFLDNSKLLLAGD